MAHHRKKKVRKVGLIEACLCNFYLIFCFGLFLGFGMAVLMLSPYKAANVIRNYLPTYGASSDVRSLTVDLRLIQEEASNNITLARKLEDAAHAIQGGKLTKRMRILCWVMTAGNSSNKIKALTVKRTWGRHCDKILFFSEHEDPEVPTIKINDVQPGRYGLWTKVVGAFKHIHKYHRNEYEWVLRADDDTYAIIENIREMLLPYSPYQPGFFGYKYGVLAPKGYFSGGGGVLVSKEALDRVVNGAFDNKHKDCKNITYSAADDDVKIAECLYAVGVEPDDSRDAKGRSRMHCFDVESHLNPDLGRRDWWYWQYLHWNVKGGLECCAENGIAWHYIPAVRQYALQFLAYNVRVENVIAMYRPTAPPNGVPVTTPSTTYQPQYSKIG